MNAAFRVLDKADVPPDLEQKFWDLWTRTWPPAPDKKDDPDFQDTAFCYVVVEDQNGELIGVCAWLDREIVVNDEPQRIAGLAGVAIEEAFRGRGLGKKLIENAIEEARKRGYEWGVLFCAPFRQTFYEQFGWRVLRGKITQTRFREETAILNDDLVMALPLTDSAAAQWPQWENARIHVGVGQW
jgi:predicted N-acetyltransferase YhbS